MYCLFRLRKSIKLSLIVNKYVHTGNESFIATIYDIILESQMKKKKPAGLDLLPSIRVNDILPRLDNNIKKYVKANGGLGKILQANKEKFVLSSSGFEVGIKDKTKPFVKKTYANTPISHKNPKESQIEARGIFEVYNNLLYCTYGSVNIKQPPLSQDDITKLSNFMDMQYDWNDEVDALEPNMSYKNLPSPKALADMFVPYTPTFEVSIIDYVNSLPPNLKEFKNKFSRNASHFCKILKRYYMIFETEGGRLRGYTIKLSSNCRHPAKGYADEFFKQFRLAPEISEDDSTDRQMQTIIEKHLLSQANKLAFTNLVQFVNNLPKEDHNLLMKFPPERLVHIIRTNESLFQLINTSDLVHGYQDVAAIETGNFPDPTDTPASTLNNLYVRLKPNTIAPGSLGNWCLNTSPCKHLLFEFAAFFYSSEWAEYPELHEKTKKSTLHDFNNEKYTSPQLNTRQWVRIDEIYNGISQTAKVELKKYKGIVVFLRLHGMLFHVSQDRQYVIGHNPTVTPPLNINTDTIVDRAALALKSSIATDKLIGRLPTNRFELMTLDPTNPLLDSKKLSEELYKLLPDYPVFLKKFITSLPPIMFAAIPSKRPHNMFLSNDLFSIWRVENQYIIQRAELGPPPEGMNLKKEYELDDILDALRATVRSQPEEFSKMMNRLPNDISGALSQYQGGVKKLILSYPQYFTVTYHPLHNTPLIRSTESSKY